MTGLGNAFFSAGSVLRTHSSDGAFLPHAKVARPVRDTTKNILAGLLGGIIVWHFYGGLLAYLLGLPDYARLASYAAFLIMTPYAFYRRFIFDAYDILVVVFTAFVWTRSFELIAENESYDLLILYLVGFCIPSLVIVRVWSFANQKFAVLMLLIGMTTCEILAASLRVSTETERAVFEFDVTSNPVGLSVSTISTVTVAVAFALHLWQSAHRGLLWRRTLSVTLLAIVAYMLVKALDLGTRSLIVALGAASSAMIVHQASSTVRALWILVVIAFVNFVTMEVFFEDWQPSQRFVEFISLIVDSKNDWSAVLRWGDAAIIDRYYLWRAYLDCFAERPLFGCGLRIGSVDAGIPYAHNIVIGVAGEFGIGGLVLLAALFVLILRDMRCIWSRKDPVATAALGLVIAGLVQLQFSLDLPIAKHFIVGAALLRSISLNAGKGQV